MNEDKKRKITNSSNGKSDESQQDKGESLEFIRKYKMVIAYNNKMIEMGTMEQQELAKIFNQKIELENEYEYVDAIYDVIETQLNVEDSNFISLNSELELLKNEILKSGDTIKYREALANLYSRSEITLIQLCRYLLELREILNGLTINLGCDVSEELSSTFEEGKYNRFSKNSPIDIIFLKEGIKVFGYDQNGIRFCRKSDKNVDILLPYSVGNKENDLRLSGLAHDKYHNWLFMRDIMNSTISKDDLPDWIKSKL